jgi:hypothetical protein
MSENQMFRLRLTQAIRIDGHVHLAGSTILADAQGAQELLQSRRAVLCDLADLGVLTDQRPVNGRPVLMTR